MDHKPDRKNKIQLSSPTTIYFLLIVLGVIAVLYYGSTILLPLTLGILVAIVLNAPMKNFQRWGLPKWAAISLSVTIMILVFLIISGLVTWQIENIAGDWDEIQKKGSQKLENINQWSESTFGFDFVKYLSNSSGVTDKLKSFGMTMLASLTTILSQSLIILIYIILFLMQKDMFLNFLRKLVPESQQQAMRQFQTGSRDIVFNYLMGKSKIMAILFVVYFLGFWVSGVPYALFLALFAALFSIIPYVGNLIGGGAAMLLAYIYSGWPAGLAVFSVVSLAQLAENYLLTPWIIGDEIDLNPFATIFGVIVFSAIWGLVGAVIALPLIGVLKVFFENAAGMEPFAYLIKKTE
ncbi:AI-2E family transporter [Membranicola marinus]|uniref:AI-2E family transporter n=1 Tax=Membranihabitans marinus TaxID=1227546 RepID=A0A953L9Q7_9BACT|nr:AI-2E family transporter [Membranihabitans marinus]MBY5959070.1 AI-2E family transporter [Membranihabitans marinus]